MSEERKVLGETLNFEERLALAQLVNYPGWKILVRLMAESCRRATEEVIRLNPAVERYPEQLTGLQTTARAMNKFSAEVLDSVKLHQRGSRTSETIQDAYAKIPGRGEVE